ncbi:MAG TPA: Gmad2 immunoglobulin-like domain-containing protein [Candidatus Portnoybacteria bacterium]|nr:Gmad2 immunoglobulin-like domain-containing protein [Candidatus Portnoybacteria bacterium]
MKENKKWFCNFNRERLLLTALVAVSFFGFLLWSIEQVSQEETMLLSAIIETNNPTENKTIKIISPRVNEIIKSPVKVSGQAMVFGAIIETRIKDTSGLVLAQKQVQTRGSQNPSSFSADIIFKKPTRTRGTVEIFIHSPKDGAESDKLIIPVVFKN